MQTKDMEFIFLEQDQFKQDLIFEQDQFKQVKCSTSLYKHPRKSPCPLPQPTDLQSVIIESSSSHLT